MAVLRESEGSVARSRLDQVWSDNVQRERALQSLLTDGLVVESEGRYALPG
jgi:A/G-specific adenine glycosylase